MVLGTTLLSWLFLKSLFHIPDGYHIGVDRDPPRYARPVDYDKMVSFDVPGGRLLGNATVSLRLDEEPKTYGRSGNAVRLRLEWDF